MQYLRGQASLFAELDKGSGFFIQQTRVVTILWRAIARVLARFRAWWIRPLRQQEVVGLVCGATRVSSATPHHAD